MTNTETAPTTSTHQAVVRRFIDRILNGGHFDELDQLIRRDYRYHGPDGAVLEGAEALTVLLQGFRGAFSDLHAGIETMIEQGDWVGTTMTLTGTHDGDFDGLPPTGERLALPIAVFSRICDGKIAEEREFFDSGAILAQLGVTDVD